MVGSWGEGGKEVDWGSGGWRERKGEIRGEAQVRGWRDAGRKGGLERERGRDTG